MDVKGSSGTVTLAWRSARSSLGQREPALTATLTGDRVIDRVSSAATRGS